MTQNDILWTILEPERLTSVVDIGANPIDGDPPYKQMLSSGLCNVIGFEPQSDAFQELMESKSEFETYISDAVGDGSEHTLYVCRASGMTSFYMPDTKYLSQFNEFISLGKVIGCERIATRKLDEINEITNIDLLKIDIQGSELSVFQSGRAKLSSAVAVQTEVSFIPLYEGQPLFWEIDKELREQGFVPHAFDAVKRWPLAPYKDRNNARKPLNQLLEADIVYVRDFINHESMDDQQIKQLALIAHHCYKSYDLVMRCIEVLVKRDSLDASTLEVYRKQADKLQYPSADDKSYGSNVNYAQFFHNARKKS